jgi:hypothetical protein
MITPQTADYTLYTCIAVGLSAVAYFVKCEIQDLLNQRKQYAEAHRLATENYIKGLLERISGLEQALRDAAMSRLELLQERKILVARNAFMAREISCDVDKKTQVLSR